MTLITHDQVAFEKSFPTTTTGARTSTLDPDFVVVGLVTLLALSVTALALASGVTVDLEPIAPFLG